MNCIKSIKRSGKIFDMTSGQENLRMVSNVILHGKDCINYVFTASCMYRQVNNYCYLFLLNKGANLKVISELPRKT